MSVLREFRRRYENYDICKDTVRSLPGGEKALFTSDLTGSASRAKAPDCRAPPHEEARTSLWCLINYRVFVESSRNEPLTTKDVTDTKFVTLAGGANLCPLGLKTPP